jgi:hypothetical protein
MSGPRALLLLALSACTSLTPTPHDTDVADSAADTDAPVEAPATLAQLADEDLVLTEVMLDPVACPTAQYLELQYRGDVPADLSGLIVSSRTQSRTLSGPILVRTGDRVVLARESSAVSDCYDVAVAAAYDLTLDPAADTLTLGDGALRLFGEVDLTTLPDGPGVAAERDDDDDDAWCAAASPIGATADRGSPGQANGACAPDDTDTPDDTDPGALIPGVDSLRPGDLTVTELMPNPTAGDDTLLEYVEVLNHTATPVDLQGLVLEDASTVTFRVTGHPAVGAGQRLLLVRDLTTFSATYGVSADAVEGLGLNNGGDLVRLLNRHGALDEVDFRGWTVPEGASLQRDDDGVWCASTTPLGATADKGTPGAANLACDAAPDTDAPADTDAPSDTDATDTDARPLALGDLAPGDLQVVELMADPSACTDPSGEYVELWVRASRPVDLAGLVLADAVTHKAFAASRVVQPGARVVLYLAGSVNCYGLTGLPYTGLTLNNAGGDQVSIEDGAGRVLDALDYRGWTLTPGRAWERDAAGAWCLADGPIPSSTDQGSPGQPNGPCPGSDTGADTDAADTDTGAADTDTTDTDAPLGPIRVDTGAHTGDSATAPRAAARAWFGGFP